MNSEIVIPVYRKHQPAKTCELQPIGGCKRCRCGKTCERARFLEPAFTVSVGRALVLIRQGLAEFIFRRTALRLTLERLENLRDQSTRADAATIFKYVEGRPGARAAIDLGWGPGHWDLENPKEVNA